MAKLPEQIKPSKMQIAFNDLEAKKARLAELRQHRHDDLLLESDKYEPLATKMGHLRRELNLIEYEYDKRHPEQAEIIELVVEEVDNLAEKLSFDTINAYLKGEKVVLVKIKNGKTKQLTPQFKVAFKQQRLFGDG